MKVHIFLFIEFLFSITYQIQKYSQEYNNLYQYITSNGGYINPKLIPNENSSTNRYIITSEKIFKNEKLLFIPDKVSLSQIHKLIFRKCLEAYGPEEGNEFDCLVYFMTLDKYNSSSFFKPYYDFLPKMNKSDFITDFSEEEIETYKYIGITQGIDSYNKFFKKAFDPVEEKLKKFSEKNKIKYEEILDVFKYNFDLVATRNFGRPGSFYDLSTMVPFLDLVNHSDKNNSYWFYEDLDGGHTLIAGRDIEPNEEIVDLYGKYHNSYLYTTYGFVIPGNIYHEYVNVYINGENYTFHDDYMNSTVKNIFDKLKSKNVKAKNYVIGCLKERIEYLLNIKYKCNRYNLKVIINEHLEIINKAINKVRNY